LCTFTPTADNSMRTNKIEAMSFCLNKPLQNYQFSNEWFWRKAK
jgi:hypothetical protein